MHLLPTPPSIPPSDNRRVAPTGIARDIGHTRRHPLVELHERSFCVSEQQSSFVTHLAAEFDEARAVVHDPGLDLEPLVQADGLTIADVQTSGGSPCLRLVHGPAHRLIEQRCYESAMHAAGVALL